MTKQEEKRTPNNILQKGWPVEKKFFENTFPEPNTGCWLWGGYANNQGYGVIYSFGRQIMAHRFSYEHHSGRKIDKDNPFVLHKCNNPCCVNPQHLYVGTQNDNMQQCFREGRGGQFYNPQRRVAQIDLKTGRTVNVYFSIMEACRQTGADQSSVSHACNGKYKHAKGFGWKYLS